MVRAVVQWPQRRVLVIVGVRRAGPVELVVGLATVAVLAILIAHFGPVSGAHFNPVVSAVAAHRRQIDGQTAACYASVQVLGCCAGAILANAMFDLALVEVSTKTRSGGGIWLAEVVATFGLLLIVFGMTRSGEHRYVPFAVAAYIAGAYWFTSSTSFANPAVTVGRSLSDTFAGIAPSSVPGFVVAQVVGAGLALGAVLVLYPRDRSTDSASWLEPSE